MLSFITSSIALAGLASAGLTQVSDSDMNDLLNQGGVDLALRAQPMWFFGQSLNQPPCIPTFASTPDNKQTPASKLCDWPDVGCDCRTPG